MWSILCIYLAVLLVVSIVTFVVFAWDKHRAKCHGWRVPEKTLHTLELLGGWPGAWLAMRWLRHKSIKKRYRVVTGLMVVLHLTALGVTVFVMVTR